MKTGEKHFRLTDSTPQIPFQNQILVPITQLKIINKKLYVEESDTTIDTTI